MNTKLFAKSNVARLFASLPIAALAALSIPSPSVAASGNGDTPSCCAPACCEVATPIASTPGGKGDYLVTVGKRTVWASQVVAEKAAASNNQGKSSCCAAAPAAK